MEFKKEIQKLLTEVGTKKIDLKDFINSVLKVQNLPKDIVGKISAEKDDNKVFEMLLEFNKNVINESFTEEMKAEIPLSPTLIRKYKEASDSLTEIERKEINKEYDEIEASALEETDEKTISRLRLEALHLYRLMSGGKDPEWFDKEPLNEDKNLKVIANTILSAMDDGTMDDKEKREIFFNHTDDKELWEKVWGMLDSGDTLEQIEQKLTLEENKSDFNDVLGIGIGEAKKEFKVNKKYTHFAVSKKTGKIVNGWETLSDVETLKHYAKTDLEDMDLNPNDFSILSKEHLIRNNTDPFNWDNWQKNNISEAKEETHIYAAVYGNDKNTITGMRGTHIDKDGNKTYSLHPGKTNSADARAEYKASILLNEAKEDHNKFLILKDLYYNKQVGTLGILKFGAMPMLEKDKTITWSVKNQWYENELGMVLPEITDSQYLQPIFPEKKNEGKKEDVAHQERMDDIYENMIGIFRNYDMEEYFTKQSPGAAAANLGYKEKERMAEGDFKDLKELGEEYDKLYAKLNPEEVNEAKYLISDETRSSFGIREDFELSEDQIEMVDSTVEAYGLEEDDKKKLVEYAQIIGSEFDESDFDDLLVEFVDNGFKPTTR